LKIKNKKLNAFEDESNKRLQEEFDEEQEGKVLINVAQ
jgi:hypothetical protein